VAVCPLLVTASRKQTSACGASTAHLWRQAVQDERRLTIGITTLQRVKGAVWQVEGDVFELHVCQASPRAVGRAILMLASVSLVLDMCVSSGAGCTASAGSRFP
jgi:hypothetical protein